MYGEIRSTVHAIVLAPVVSGLGVSLTGAWVIASARGRYWLMKIIQRLDGLRGQVPFSAVNSDSLQWSGNRAHRDRVQYFMKPLFTKSRSGPHVVLVRYPAGTMNPAHSHPTGHGMYVLKGRLVTHRGTFGPGTYVWFPPGETMTHGATEDGDSVVLFIVGGDSRTDYATDSPPIGSNRA
jgi:quercetin dioxygenase-like cupin family protein